jgi:hypothetical protein
MYYVSILKIYLSSFGTYLPICIYLDDWYSTSSENGADIGYNVKFTADFQFSTTRLCRKQVGALKYERNAQTAVLLLIKSANLLSELRLPKNERQHGYVGGNRGR